MDSFKCELLSWTDSWVLARSLSAKILEAGFRPDAIVAVIRGGMVPAMCLSDLMSVYDVFSLRACHWGKTAEKDACAVLKDPVRADLSGKSILLVDDLTDSGKSLELALENVYSSGAADVKTATLIHKPSSSHVPDFYSRSMDSWKWIIFPWNLKEDLSSLSEKLPGKDLKKEFKEEFGLVLTDEVLSIIHG